MHYFDAVKRRLKLEARRAVKSGRTAEKRQLTKGASVLLLSSYGAAAAAAAAFRPIISFPPVRSKTPSANVCFTSTAPQKSIGYTAVVRRARTMSDRYLREGDERKCDLRGSAESQNRFHEATNGEMFYFERARLVSSRVCSFKIPLSVLHLFVQL